jgi:hypothetical protein
MISIYSCSVSVMRSLPSAISAANCPPFRGLFRKPRRISVTLPDSTALLLEQRSQDEGRSISNLAAFLLERGLTADEG